MLLGFQKKKRCTKNLGGILETIEGYITDQNTFSISSTKVSNFLKLILKFLKKKISSNSQKTKFFTKNLGGYDGPG